MLRGLRAFTNTTRRFSNSAGTGKRYILRQLPLSDDWQPNGWQNVEPNSVWSIGRRGQGGESKPSIARALPQPPCFVKCKCKRIVKRRHPGRKWVATVVSLPC